MITVHSTHRNPLKDLWSAFWSVGMEHRWSPRSVGAWLGLQYEQTIPRCNLWWRWIYENMGFSPNFTPCFLQERPFSLVKNSTIFKNLSLYSFFFCWRVWCVRFNPFHDQLLLTASSDARVLLSSAASVSSENLNDISVAEYYPESTDSKTKYYGL